MKRFVVVALSILTFFLFSAPVASAKGRTVKITIKGAGVAKEITSAAVQEFGVWEGPGVRLNGLEQTEGFIIQWSQGIVTALPTGLQNYEVSFYTGCDAWSEPNCQSSEPLLTYIVTYAYDPTTQTGFVYLPGKRDKAFQYNSTMWHGHGYEGNWLRATRAWDDFVKALISAAP